MRALDASRSTAVIRGDRLPEDIFAPESLEAFLHDYGIEFVVLEDGPDREPYETVRTAPAPSMALVGQTTITAGNMPGGELLVYRFMRPSKTPESDLVTGSTVMRGGMKVELH
jgi:hypothetical protein